MANIIVTHLKVQTEAQKDIQSTSTFHYTPWQSTIKGWRKKVLLYASGKSHILNLNTLPGSVLSQTSVGAGVLRLNWKPETRIREAEIEQQRQSHKIWCNPPSEDWVLAPVLWLVPTVSDLIHHWSSWSHEAMRHEAWGMCIWDKIHKIINFHRSSFHYAKIVFLYFHFIKDFLV